MGPSRSHLTTPFFFPYPLSHFSYHMCVSTFRELYSIHIVHGGKDCNGESTCNPDLKVSSGSPWATRDNIPFVPMWTNEESLWNTLFILSFCISIWFTDIFDMFKRLANVLMDKCRLFSMMEATVLVLILVTEVLGLSHLDASWTDFWSCLNSLCHLQCSNYSRTRHSSSKAFFSNRIEHKI